MRSLNSVERSCIFGLGRAVLPLEEWLSGRARGPVAPWRTLGVATLTLEDLRFDRFVEAAQFGFPVARVVRSKRDYEKAVEQAAMVQLKAMFDPVAGRAASDATAMDLQLLGDHQLGTCRMGDDPETSVVDRDCRLHALKNVFVVDTSFMPTGCGVNPMMTVVANALRVGSII